MLTENFDKEFYNGNLSVREFDVILSFNDDCHTEKAAMDFLDSLGFRVTDNGYKYLVHIIKECVKSDSLSQNLVYWYDVCAVEFDTSRKSVETGIANAIKTAGKSGRLRKMNEIFNCEYVVCDSISNSMFISAITRRFCVSRKYEREIRFKV